MKKRPVAKLQLRKSVIAQFDKQLLGHIGGGTVATVACQITRTPDCYRSEACPVSQTCVMNCVPTVRQTIGELEDSARICNTGHLQTVDVPCQY